MQNIKLNYKKTALISDKQIIAASKRLNTYLVHLNQVAKNQNYNFDEASINLAFDKKLLSQIKKLIKNKQTKKLKYIIVIGIGGSNLGAKAVYEALYGQLDEFNQRQPKIIFADTVSPKLLQSIKNILKTIKSPDEVCLNLITKSGGTTEPVANFETLCDFLEKKLGQIKNRIVITTGRESKLWEMAQKQGFSLFDIPQKVGGRYSVFSAVGLFPLALAGINIDQLLQGARTMRNQCLQNNISKNPALVSAVLVYLYNKKNIRINNTFLFNPELESVGKWYRQLMGESIGKERNATGKVVHAGITPIVSIGSTDLHSMAQLYFGGPRDKFTTFVYNKQENFNIKVPQKVKFDNLVAGIKGKNLASIMDAIYGGVRKSYIKHKLPFVEIVMPEISAYTLGQYLQFKMIEMMFLAKLLGLNAFDQPNVEGYKNETRRLLV